MVALEKVNKTLHQEISNIPSRQKSFGLLTWLFSWGMYTNAKNIKKIKQNLTILPEQNNLQESQIMELTHYLNLTIMQVCEQ